MLKKALLRLRQSYRYIETPHSQGHWETSYCQRMHAAPCIWDQALLLDSEWKGIHQEVRRQAHGQTHPRGDDLLDTEVRLGALLVAALSKTPRQLLRALLPAAQQW